MVFHVGFLSAGSYNTCIMFVQGSYGLGESLNFSPYLRKSLSLIFTIKSP